MEKITEITESYEANAKQTLTSENKQIINFYDSLPTELLPEILLFCDKDIFKKIYFLTAKQVKKELKSAIASQINTIFKQSVSAWKELDENTIRNIVTCLQEEKEITALLKQIDEWIQGPKRHLRFDEAKLVQKVAKKFLEWINIFGNAYIESYQADDSNFKTNEHHALYGLITTNIANSLDRLAVLLTDEHLASNYPSITKSLKKSYLIAMISKENALSPTLETHIKELVCLIEDSKTNPIFFFNLMGINSIDIVFQNLANEDVLSTIVMKAQLCMANLSGMKLQGTNLFASNLSGANLSRANLFSANLSLANLNGANLTNACLFRAHLVRADLRKVDLRGANLSSANLEKADLRGAKLAGANLKGVILNGNKTCFNGANLTDVNFSSSELQSIKQSSLLILEKRIKRATVAELIDIYQQSICEGNLWDIPCYSILDNAIPFFETNNDSEKQMTKDRKKLNAFIINRANELIAIVLDTEKSALETLLHKILGAETTEKTTSSSSEVAKINYSELLPNDIYLGVLSHCNNATFSKIHYLTSKETHEKNNTVITESIDKVFEQPSTAWKLLDESHIKKAIDFLHKKAHIKKLLKLINKWIETRYEITNIYHILTIKGARDLLQIIRTFYVWIEVFGPKYIERFETKGSDFNLKEHQALYCLVTHHINNMTDTLFTLWNDEQLNKNYPVVTKSLKKSYFLILLSKTLNDHPKAAEYVEILRQLDKSKKNPVLFFNGFNINNIVEIIELMRLPHNPVRVKFRGNLIGTASIAANFRGVDLYGANFSGIDLRSSRFENAVLWGTIFRKANLSGVDFSKQNLTRADIDEAILIGANFNKTDLHGASLSAADLTSTNFIGAKLTYANFSKAILHGADFSGADLNTADFSYVNLDELGEKYKQVNFNGANLTGVICSSEKLKMIKASNLLLILNKLEKAQPYELFEIYKNSICKGNLWDIQTNSLFNKFFNKKSPTDHRKKLNAAIVERARQLINHLNSPSHVKNSSERNEEITFLEKLIKKINPISDQHELGQMSESSTPTFRQ